MDYFTKEVNPSLLEPHWNFNNTVAKLGLTSFKYSTHDDLSYNFTNENYFDRDCIQFLP